MKGVQPPDTVSGTTRSWWASILAGQIDDPHPIYGADIDVAFKGGLLRLSGVLPSADDRKRVLAEAREFVGHGIDDVDAKHLTVAKREEKSGILDQTLIAAFPNREVAEYASEYLLRSRRVEPKQLEILDSGKEDKARKLLPEAFLDDVHRAFEAREAVVILTVDETSAFKARELLDEETRSLWTIATPPIPAAGKRG
jgi:hypothetical protein